MPDFASALVIVTLVFALAGMVKGLKPESFRRWFFIGLVALGVYMVVRALG